MLSRMAWSSARCEELRTQVLLRVKKVRGFVEKGEKFTVQNTLGQDAAERLINMIGNVRSLGLTVQTYSISRVAFVF